MSHENCSVTKCLPLKRSAQRNPLWKRVHPLNSLTVEKEVIEQVFGVKTAFKVQFPAPTAVFVEQIALCKSNTGPSGWSTYQLRIVSLPSFGLTRGVFDYPPSVEQSRWPQNRVNYIVQQLSPYNFHGLPPEYRKGYLFSIRGSSDAIDPFECPHWLLNY